MNYLYFGEDSGVILYFLKEDLKKVGIKYLDTTIYDGHEDKVSEVIYDASLISLFGDKKIIVFKNCNCLSDPRSNEYLKTSEKELKSLFDYLKNPNDECDIYLLVTHVNKTWLKKLVKECQVNIVDCSFFDDEKRRSYILKRAKEENITIQTDALSELIKRCEGDFLLLVNNTEKLLSYAKNITIENVDELIYEKIEDKTFSIASSLLTNDRAMALKYFQDLITLGRDPLRIIPALVYQFRLYYLVSYLVSKGEDEKSIASELKISSNYAYMLKKFSKRYKPNTFLKILDRLYSIEYDIKKYSSDGKVLLELFILTYNFYS